MNLINAWTAARSVHKKLSSRSIRVDEPVRLYVLEMTALGSQINIDEEELVAFIIDGLNDSSPAVILLYGIKKLVDLKRMLPEYRISTSYRPAPSTTYRPVPAAAPGATAVVRCYNCREHGHIQAACTRPRRPPGACFKCFETNHVYKDCQLRHRVGLIDEIPDDSSQQLDQQDGEMSVIQFVSVAFPSYAIGGTSVRSLIFTSLFDTGSPASFVRRSVLPDGVPEEMLSRSPYKGMGNENILTYGTIELEIEFGYKNKLVSLCPNNKFTLRCKIYRVYMV